MKGFLNSTVIPLYAPEGVGMGGNQNNITQIDVPLDQLPDPRYDDGSDQSRQQQRQQNRGQNDDQNQLTGDLSVDADAILAQFWNTQDDGNGDGGDDSDNQNQNQNQNQQRQQQNNDQGGNQNQQADDGSQAAAEQLTRDIEALGLPADLLPADFDPSNREQLNAAFVRVQKETARSSLRLVFPIMSKALTAMQERFRQEMSDRISEFSSTQRTDVMLAEAIPQINDPALGPVVRTLFAQAKTRHKNIPRAIQATKQSLQALGIKLGAPVTSNDAGDQPIRQTANPAKSSLDSFFPGIPAQRNPVQRRMQQQR